MKSFLLDLFFPRKCVGCRAEGNYFCSECRANLKCDLKSEKLGEIDCLISLYRYRSTPVVQKLIKLMKYKFCAEIVDIFDSDFELCKLGDLKIVPVPLHESRLKYRGFNQAKVIANKLGLELYECLERTKATDQQARINREARLDNLAGAFELRLPIDSGDFLLVDDVATTGATLNACAKVLKDAGAKKVLALVIARG